MEWLLGKRLNIGWLSYSDPNFISSLEWIMGLSPATFGDRQFKSDQRQVGDFLEALNKFKEEHKELYGCVQTDYKQESFT